MLRGKHDDGFGLNALAIPIKAICLGPDLQAIKFINPDIEKFFGHEGSGFRGWRRRDAELGVDGC